MFNILNRILVVVMFKFGIGALIGIVIYVQLASCTGNETFLDTAADLVYHFPNYLEDAVNFEIEQEEKTDNNKWLYLFARGQCLRDFLHVFGALRKKSLWAIQGKNLSIKQILI